MYEMEPRPHVKYFMNAYNACGQSDFLRILPLFRYDSLTRYNSKYSAVFNGTKNNHLRIVHNTLRSNYFAKYQ